MNWRTFQFITESIAEADAISEAARYKREWISAELVGPKEITLAISRQRFIEMSKYYSAKVVTEGAIK